MAREDGLRYLFTYAVRAYGFPGLFCHLYNQRSAYRQMMQRPKTYLVCTSKYRKKTFEMGITLLNFREKNASILSSVTALVVNSTRREDPPKSISLSIWQLSLRCRSPEFIIVHTIPVHIACTEQHRTTKSSSISWLHGPLPTSNDAK